MNHPGSPRQRTGSKSWRHLVAALAVTILTLGAGGGPEEELARAQELLDGGNAAAARVVVDGVLKRQAKNASALVMRSTANFMLGDTESGRRDLTRALKLDPSIRQAWLNSAALELSEGDYQAALEAFLRARELDPAAPENELNIGAVLLLQGELEAANESFRAYLERNPESADASYLVASNYAMAGYSGVAIQQLGRAIELDERSRRRARSDPNFSALASSQEFQQILATDAYQPPAGAHRAEQVLPAPYAGAESESLTAVLDALQLAGHPFDPQIEVTPHWTLIWAEARIRLSPAADGGTRLQLSAPAERFTPTEWRSWVEGLLGQVAVQLQTRFR